MHRVETKMQNIKSIIPIIILLMTSVDTVIFGTNGTRLFLYVPRIVALAMCIYSIFIVGKAKVRGSKALFVLLCLAAITLTSGLYNKTETVTIISRLLPLFVGYCLSEYYSFDDFIDAFDKVLHLVAVVSIALYFLTALTPNIVMRFPSFLNENGIRAYTIILGSVLSNSGFKGILSRMSGIFWEPGAYSIYLCLGIVFQLFFREKTDNKRVILYIVCAIITFSTTGIIGLVIIGLAYLQKKNAGSSNLMKFGIVVSLGILLAASLFAEDSVFINTFFSKITGRTGTTIVRYSSLINGFQIALDHPWLGVGGQTGNYMSQYAILSGYGRNNMLTNTYVHQFANYGFVFGTIFIICTFSFFWRVKEQLSKFISIILFVLLIVLYSGETFFSFLPFVFVFYGTNRGSLIRDSSIE